MYVSYNWPNGWTELADIFLREPKVPQEEHRLKNIDFFPKIIFFTSKIIFNTKSISFIQKSKFVSLKFTFNKIRGKRRAL